jgi:hypothetical protein
VSPRSKSRLGPWSTCRLATGAAAAVARRAVRQPTAAEAQRAGMIARLEPQRNQKPVLLLE